MATAYQALRDEQVKQQFYPYSREPETLEEAKPYHVEAETKIHRFGQIFWTSGVITGFQKISEGVSPMSEPTHIKGIFDEIALVRKEQDQKFGALEKSVEEVKADLKGLRREFKEDLTNGIKDLKDSVIFRLDAFEKSAEERFSSQRFVSKVLGTGIGANVVASLFALLKLWFK